MDQVIIYSLCINSLAEYLRSLEGIGFEIRLRLQQNRKIMTVSHRWYGAEYTTILDPQFPLGFGLHEGVLHPSCIETCDEFDSSIEWSIYFLEDLDGYHSVKTRSYGSTDTVLRKIKQKTVI